ncbi:MAG: hypothetical protein AAGH60_06280 [Pseudomonadota bacterium]
MLSVVVRTQNAERVLLDTLRPLISAAAEGLVLDVAFADVGSQDGTKVIADAAGAEFVSGNEADQLTMAALKAARRGSWVLMLDQGTVISSVGISELASFAESHARAQGNQPPVSACFPPKFHWRSVAGLKHSASTLLSNRLGGRAWLAQGVLIHRSHFSNSADKALGLDWTAQNPSVRLPTLVRLNSSSSRAQPVVFDEPNQGNVAPNALPHAS